MGRSLRLNSSSGGASASSSSGITLDDVEDAFFSRRKLQEVALDASGVDAIEFKDLDTEQYDHFHIRCSRVHTQNNSNFVYFGCMNGTTRITAQNWSTSGYWGTSFFANNTSGEAYTFSQNNTLDDAEAVNSFKVFEFNLYFPDPNASNSIPSMVVGDYTFWHGQSGGYQTRSGYANWRTQLQNSAVPNGFYFRPSNGNWTQDDDHPSIYTIYGTKRRKPN
jgi:hypothetical protein